MSTAKPGSVRPVLVLGLGNLLLTDDGFGPTLVERLRDKFGDHPDLEFVDGGTMGLGLLSLLADRRAVLLLDAFQVGEAPGTLIVRRDFNWDQAGSSKGRSAHEGNAAGLLAVAALTGDLPGRLAVIGIEPDRISTGIGLSEVVEAQLAEAETIAFALIGELLEVSQCV